MEILLNLVLALLILAGTVSLVFVGTLLMLFWMASRADKYDEDGN
jgi:hypothetical protein